MRTLFALEALIVVVCSPGIVSTNAPSISETIVSFDAVNAACGTLFPATSLTTTSNVMSPSSKGLTSNPEKATAPPPTGACWAADSSILPDSSVARRASISPAMAAASMRMSTTGAVSVSPFTTFAGFWAVAFKRAKVTVGTVVSFTAGSPVLEEFSAASAVTAEMVIGPSINPETSNPVKALVPPGITFWATD